MLEGNGCVLPLQLRRPASWALRRWRPRPTLTVATNPQLGGTQFPYFLVSSIWPLAAFYSIDLC